MRYLLACALLLCGCDNPDFWEYQVYAPKNATPERLMEIERLLLTNGYKRVSIVGVDLGRAVVIYATKKEGGAE